MSLKEDCDRLNAIVNRIERAVNRRAAQVDDSPEARMGNLTALCYSLKAKVNDVIIQCKDNTKRLDLLMEYFDLVQVTVEQHDEIKKRGE